MDELEEGEIGDDSISEKLPRSRPRPRTKPKQNAFNSRSKSQRKFSRNSKDIFESVNTDLRRRQQRVEPIQRISRKNIPRNRKPPDILSSSRTTNRLSSLNSRSHSRPSALTPLVKHYISDTLERRNARNHTKSSPPARDANSGQASGFSSRERRFSCVEAPSRDATYEDLLRQYRQIRRELTNITQQEERHDKENRKSQNTPRRRRSASQKSEKRPPIIEEQEDDLSELRKKALESLIKKASNKPATEIESQQEPQEDWNAVVDNLLEENFLKVTEQAAAAVCSDNYEAVDMELDSQGESGADDDGEEEEEKMLREQLLMSMKRNKKEEPVQPVPPSFEHAKSKLVINLAEDSSDESEDETDGEREIELPAGLDHFLKTTRLKVEQQQKAERQEEELKILRRAMSTSAVTSLSRAQQAEYHKLKEEIAKRECGKKGPQTNPLAACEDKLRRERSALLVERQRLTSLHLQALGKRKEVRSQQLRLQKMNLQVAALKKVLAAGLTDLQRLRLQMQLVQSLVETRVTTVRTLNRECLQLGRLARGPTYKLPASAPRKRRISACAPAPASKRMRTEVERLGAEKERLLQLEKEVAQRLQQLRKNQTKALPISPPKTSSPTRPASEKEDKTLVSPDTTLPLCSFHWVFPAQQNNSKPCDWVPPLEEPKTKPKLFKRTADRESFSAYNSCLLHLHSYRLNPSYVKREGQLLSATSHANLVDPGRHLCRFDLLGTCNDDSCTWQHASRYQPSAEDVIADLASYMPQMETSEETYKFARDFLSKRMGQDLEDNCRELVQRLRKDCKLVEPHFVRTEKRLWRPVGERRLPLDRDDSARPKVCKLLMRPEDFDPDATVSEEDARYFTGVPNRLASLEAAVTKNNSDVKLWLKLAEHHLVSGASESCLERAMDVLSRALESNRASVELWLRYLHLYSKHKNSSDLPSICQQALQFCHSYQLWWKYLQVAEGYESKLEVCRHILAFLLSGEDDDRPFHLLEVFLFAIQLSVQSGHLQKSIDFFQNLFELSSDSAGMLLEAEDLKHLNVHLPVLWLCYLHLMTFRRLPSCLFRDDNPGPLLSTESFLIAWPESVKANVSVDSLRTLFSKALDDCKARGLTPSARHPVHINLIAFEWKFHGLEVAISEGQKLLTEEPEQAQMWVFLATFCLKNNQPKQAQQLLDESISKLGHVPVLCNAAARLFLDRGQVDEALSCLRDGLPDFARDSQTVLQSYTSLLECGKIADPAERSYVLANRELSAMCLNINVFDLPSIGNLTEQDSKILRYQQVELALRNRDQTSMRRVHGILKGLVLSGDHSSELFSMLDSFCGGLVDPAAALDSFLTLAPNDVKLAERTVKRFLESDNKEMALNIGRRFLGKRLGITWMWKLAIEEAICERDHQEVHNLFGSATRAVPYSADLWKALLSYERSQKHQDHVDSAVACCQRLQIQTTNSSQ